MPQPPLPPSVARFGALSGFLLPAIHAVNAGIPREVGHEQPDFYKQALGGRKPLSPVLDRVLAHQLADTRVPNDALAIYPARLRSYLRLVRGIRPPAFRDACECEQAAHCALDPLQWRAARTLSVGDLYAMEAKVAAQVEATMDLYDALLSEIAVRESGREWAA